MFDLEKIQKRTDDILEKETEFTLNRWMDTRRMVDENPALQAPYYIGMVYAGELKGKLEFVRNQIAIREAKRQADLECYWETGNIIFLDSNWEGKSILVDDLYNKIKKDR